MSQVQTNAVATKLALGAVMLAISMEVNKKEGGKYVKQGEVTIYVPTLKAVGLDVEPLKLDDTGLPDYETEAQNFLFGCVLAAAKADARNKLEPGTATVREGAKIAETLEELMAVGERGGEALKVYRAMVNDFKAYLTTTGKKEAVQNYLSDLVSNRKALTSANQKAKDAISTYLADFATKLTEEKQVAYLRPLISVSEACSASMDDLLADL